MFCRTHHSTGGAGHSSREKMAGDSYKCGQHEGWQERRSISLALPGPWEQEREKSDPGLWTGKS